MFVITKSMFLTTQTKKIKIDNTIVKIQMSWKEPRNLKLNELFVSVGDKISIGDKIFSYNFINDKKIHIYLSDKEGIIKKFIKRKDILQIL